MSDDLSDWGDPDTKKIVKGGDIKWPSLWKAVVSVGGLVLIFYEAILAHEVNFVIVIAAMAMMGFPVARWLDKM